MSDMVRQDSYVATSPFDVIRREDEHGEYWSARDLMALLGYEKWQRFEDVIGRASLAATNSGSPAGQFVQVSQLTEGGNLGPQRRTDYRLTRYACYLLAMNADPRQKPEVADAQTYFAVRTREAETAAMPDLSTAAGVLVMAEQFAATARRLVLAEQRVAELEPRAAAADALTEADGTLSIGAVAKMFKVGRTTFFRILYAEGILCRDRTPRQEYAAWFRVIATPRETGIGKVIIDHVSYLYPEGALRLHHLLTHRGYQLARPTVGGQLALEAAPR